MAAAAAVVVVANDAAPFPMFPLRTGCCLINCLTFHIFFSFPAALSSVFLLFRPSGQKERSVQKKRHTHTPKEEKKTHLHSRTHTHTQTRANRGKRDAN